jgi:hypothetical protein
MGGSRHDGREVASSARPSPMTKAMKVSACAVDCSALRACASQVACAFSTSTKPCAATATSSTWVATMAITSSERRSRPAGSTRMARRTSPRSAAQMPSTASSSAPISAAITGVREAGASACSKPSFSAEPMASSRSVSSNRSTRSVMMPSVPSCSSRCGRPRPCWRCCWGSSFTV